VSYTRVDDELSLPYPIEFVICETAKSFQGKSSGSYQRWKARVNELARAHANSLSDFHMLDDRQVAATLLFLPMAKMGDVDNYLKGIIDGMDGVFYNSDNLIERVVAQKVEPGVTVSFDKVTPTLGQVLDMGPPVIYVRIDDDLKWRRGSL